MRSAAGHDEGRLLHGVVADGDDEVRLVDRLMNPVTFGQRRRAHIQRRSGVHRTLPHLGVEERNSETADEARQRLGQLWTAGAGAQHHQRPCRCRYHRRRALDRHGRCDRKLDRMRCDDIGGGLFSGHVLRQFEMDRSRPFLLRDPESVAHQGWNALRRDDLGRHLGQRPHRRDDIDDLEFGLAARPDRLLACDHHHRHRAQLGIGRRSRKIEGPRPQRRQANAGAPRQPAIGCRHEAGGLLVPGQDQPDLGVPQGFQNVEVFLARNREDTRHALVFECRDQKIRAFCHACTS